MISLYKSFIVILLIFPYTFGTQDYVFYPEVNVYYKMYVQGMSWPDAYFKCLDEDATLAMPKNEHELKTIKKIYKSYIPSIKATNNSFKDFILLGFYDIFRESEYLTTGGYNYQYYYHEWAKGEPNGGKAENCGTMHSSGLLNDAGCDIKLAFICQKEILPYTIELSNHFNLNTDPAYNWEPHSQKRFKLHLDPRPWNEARTICMAEGGQLALIGSKQEEDFLVNMFNRPENKVTDRDWGAYAFLGFHDTFKEGRFVTVTGKDLKSVGYVRWNYGQPDNAGGKEHCGSMHINGPLNDLPCDAKVIFFCEQYPGNYTTTISRLM